LLAITPSLTKDKGLVIPLGRDSGGVSKENILYLEYIITK
jgi:hypothetical protein